jgi:predicted dehydrogenase/threonine dehydrogenase-like Zn-dependent dehydrogenase
VGFHCSGHDSNRMKQVVQSVSGGPVRIVDVPRPVIGPNEVLVQVLSSAISSGTERALMQLAGATLLGKARARPDLVKQVVRKARSEGLRNTLSAVRSSLDEDFPLGYSACGIALEVGEAVSGISPGEIVATGGGGRANHAEYQAVPGLLCSPVPEGVAPAEAALATIASVSLHALRLANLGPGSRVAIVGMGLLGQLALRLANASGCSVAAIDVDPFPLEPAERSGALALEENGQATTRAIMSWSRGQGVDAAIITAGTKMSDAVMRCPEICRDRATIVVVGDVGLELERTPFYEKELSIRFARSYGPGRYERTYEEWGVDYPPGHVRWTEGRNMQAVLRLLADRKVDFSDLVTHTFEIGDAGRAYELIQKRSEPYLAIEISYPRVAQRAGPITHQSSVHTHTPGLGLIGAGKFAKTTLLPALKGAGFDNFVSVASSSGLTAEHLAESAGFARAVPGAEAVIHDPDVDVVVIATRHDSHARYAADALRAGKHVFCEKPLALTMEELNEVEVALASSKRVLFVDFNRRWSGPIAALKAHFSSGTGPLCINYRINAGELPPDHWYKDRRQGGRLMGEVCHFVDTCATIAGHGADRLKILPSMLDHETLLSEQVVVGLHYPDESLATIAYATAGHPATPKEYVEVLGQGHTASILDYRSIVLDGKRQRFRQDKGHRRAAQAFLGAVSHGVELDPIRSSALESSKTILQLAAALSSA